MKEPSIGCDQSLIAHDEAPKVSQPGKRPRNDPPPAIPPQLPPILMGRVLVVPPCRDNRVDTPPRQTCPQRVAIVAAIRNQAVGPLAGAPRLPQPPDGDRVEGALEEGDLRRGRRVQVCSQRSTRAIDQNQPLCTLPAFRVPDFGPPFFAGTKLPSAKHSSQRSLSWSLSWAKKARQSVSNAPLSSQALSRRQHVLELPYRRGSSLHWAPVHRIHKTPSKQRRSSTRGRPPRRETLGWGRWTRLACHCSLVRPRHAMCCLPVLLGNSWRYHTLIARF
jgi:hypothetical protein